MNKCNELTIADSVCDLRSRKIKSTYFHQMDELLDWKAINKTLGKYYTKGKSDTGTDPEKDLPTLLHHQANRIWNRP